MNYNFWKKAGIATGAIGTIAIGSAVLANEAAPTTDIQQRSLNNRPGIAQKMHNAKQFMHNEEVQKAIENRDYDAFVKAVSLEGNTPRILETITAQNFDSFADMHDAMKSNDFEKAREIANELGLPQMGERGMHNGPKFHTQEEREAIREAALNGDYETWFNLVAVDGELPEFLQVINKGNFARYQEMHQLMYDAKSIREELGLEARGNGSGKGMGRGMGMRMHR